MKLHNVLPAGWLTLFGIVLGSGCMNNTKSSPTTGSSAPMQSRQPAQQSSGVVQNVRQAGKRAADMGELKNFALAYYTYVSENNRGPSSVQDLKGSLTTKSMDAFADDNIYVVKWKLTNLSGSTIVAYVKEPDSYGTRLVAKGDGSVARMTKEEFEQATAGR